MGEWETLGEEKAEAVLKALSHPKRRLIYGALASSPLRQHRLAKEPFPQPLKRDLEPRHLKYDDALLRHHLGPLEQAGLIDFYVEGNEKYVRRVLDVRVQVKRRPEQKPLPEEAPKTREEAERRVREVFARKRE